jgi:hypothetical protein
MIMNRRIHSASAGAVFLFIAALFATPSLRAASLSINPPAVTNDYVGKIALSITGLSSGQAVRVRYFMDLNGNSLVDPAEPAIRIFKVTDGQMPMIGGVTNLNVPGDMDGLTNGQIQVLLDFPGMDSVLDAAVGSFIYLVSDAQTDTPLATNTFTVAQKQQPQGIRGHLSAATGGYPLTNVPVALAMPNGPGGALGVTDTNGDYFFYTQPGGYAIVPVIPGFVADQNAGFANVGANQFVTNDLALTSGSYYLAGTIADASNPAKGVGGVFVQADTAGNLFAGTFTDTNGNFALLVTPGQWRISPSSEGMAEHGYIGLQDGLTTNVVSAGVSNINILLPKATALIYGTLKDTDGQAIQGVGLSANDTSHVYKAAGLSGSDGNFVIGVTAGNWNASPDTDALTSLGYMSVDSTNVLLTSGQALRVDFLVQSASSYVTGTVVDFQGNPLANLGVSANNNGSGHASTQTSGNGEFVLPLSGGAWVLNLDAQALASQGLVGPQLDLNITNGVSISNLTLIAVQATAQLSGIVFDQQSNTVAGIGVAGVVTLNGTNYSSWSSTGTNGAYAFAVVNGTWSLALSCYDLSQHGYGCPGGTNVTVNGEDLIVNFVVPPSQPPPPLMITTTTLPIAALNQPYECQLEATGGNPGYTWSMSLGSLNLPGGLNLSSSGLLSGTPTNVGQFYFVVRVTDNSLSADDQTLGLTILVPPTLSNARRLSSSQFQLTASGAPGSPTYEFQYSTNLFNWTTLLLTNAPSTPFSVVDPFATNKVRFYRLSVY